MGQAQGETKEKTIAAKESDISVNKQGKVTESDISVNKQGKVTAKTTKSDQTINNKISKVKDSGVHEEEWWEDKRIWSATEQAADGWEKPTTPWAKTPKRQPSSSWSEEKTTSYEEAAESYEESYAAWKGAEAAAWAEWMSYQMPVRPPTAPAKPAGPPRPTRPGARAARYERPSEDGGWSLHQAQSAPAQTADWVGTPVYSPTGKGDPYGFGKESAYGKGQYGKGSYGKPTEYDYAKAAWEYAEYAAKGAVPQKYSKGGYGNPLYDQIATHAYYETQEKDDKAAEPEKKVGRPKPPVDDQKGHKGAKGGGKEKKDECDKGAKGSGKEKKDECDKGAKGSGKEKKDEWTPKSSKAKEAVESAAQPEWAEGEDWQEDNVVRQSTRILARVDALMQEVGCFKTLNHLITDAGRQSPGLLLTVADKLGSQMNAVNIATTLHRIAKLGLRGSAQQQMLGDPRFASLRKRAAESIKSGSDEAVGPWCLSIQVWAHASLGIKDEELFTNAARRMLSSDSLNQFKSFELTNVAWAFATMNLKHGKLFQALGAEALVRLSDFSAQCLSSLLWSFATLEYRNVELLRAVRIPAVGGAAEASTAAWAFTVLQVEAPKLAFACRNAVKRAPADQTKPKCLANLVWALSMQGHTDYLRTAVDPLCAMLKPKTSRAKAERALAAKVAWAYARAGVPAKGLFKLLASGAESMPPREVTVLAHACSTAGVMDPALCRSLERAFLRSNVPKATGTLVLFLRGLQIAGHTTDSVWNSIISQVCSKSQATPAALVLAAKVFQDAPTGVMTSRVAAVVGKMAESAKFKFTVLEAIEFCGASAMWLSTFAASEDLKVQYRKIAKFFARKEGDGVDKFALRVAAAALRQDMPVMVMPGQKRQQEMEDWLLGGEVELTDVGVDGPRRTHGWVSEATPTGVEAAALEAVAALRALGPRVEVLRGLVVHTPAMIEQIESGTGDLEGSRVQLAWQGSVPWPVLSDDPGQAKSSKVTDANLPAFGLAALKLTQALKLAQAFSVNGLDLDENPHFQRLSRAAADSENPTSEPVRPPPGLKVNWSEKRADSVLTKALNDLRDLAKLVDPSVCPRWRSRTC